ncbi:MAG: aminotransferase class I/II-fold pyridoxal phosphate-dependent enzyme [Planctomycetota bacterium]|nr:aminotransferase class I/II-fold pyridoxal phosphate-dependent enzyme [Planctomycetota bacterium]
MRPARRIDALPPYLFAEIDRLKAKALAEGRDVIDLGVGDPDIPVPEEASDILSEAIRKYENKFYPPYAGTVRFREAVARFYSKRSHVSLEPDREVIGLIGSKEGLAHLSLAFINPGDVALIADPAYPVYANGVRLAGGVPVSVPLRRENGFMPALDEIDEQTAHDAKLMFINYPNNPTTTLADKRQLARIVDFARANDILIAYDHAYSELVFEPYRSPSILEIDGAKEVAIEFNSLSKMFNVTGWRVAWAAGCEQAVAGLAKVKTNVDSGQFKALQEAGAWMLDELYPEVPKANSATYARRSRDFCSKLADAGWDVIVPRATFFVWAAIEGPSMEAVSEIIEKTSVICIPGRGSGEAGEGYVRFALNLDDDRVAEAAQRLASIRK